MRGRGARGQVRILTPTAAEALVATPLSTHLVDTDGPAPPAHVRLTTTRPLLRRDFDAAAQELLRWRMHRGAGLRVESSAPRAAVGAVVRLTLGPFAGGPGLSVSCRVVDVIEEEHRRGFTYATLTGHVESGVQTFTVQRDQPEGRLHASVVSVSAPAHPLLRLAGPVARQAQRIMATRYCRALETTETTVD